MRERKPIIGVLPLWDDGKQSIWMLPGYVDAVRESGGVPIIFPLVCSEQDLAQLCEMCDGFLLTGGDDVDPLLYNQTASERCGKPNKLRDLLEKRVFEYALSVDKPVLGICRGIQLINALCGGTLYQDLPTEYLDPKAISHQMTPPYDRPLHSVDIVSNTQLSVLVGGEKLAVNSYHHQAVKTLASSLEPMAISEDGLVEAVYMKDKKFVWAVQWHPEFDFHCNETSRKIFACFVSAC